MRARIGRFDVIRRLGEGGMGAVYLARDPELDALVAIKVTGSDSGDASVAAMRRLRREFRMMQRLRHEHIVQVYEIFEEHGLQFFSMEYVDGGNLHRHLGVLEDVAWGLPSERSTQQGKVAPRKAGVPVDEDGPTGSFPAPAPRGSLSPSAPPTVDAVANAIAQLLSALTFIHEAGVVHRDLKPSNILMTPQGQLKLMDFGVARPPELEDVTSSGLVVGTYAYMSPEQAEGKEVDGRTDLYSVGVLLYELVTGRPPFLGSTPMELMWKHVHEPPPDPIRVRPEADPDLARIALKCLQKDPRKRFQDAPEIRRALERRHARSKKRPRSDPKRRALLFAPNLVGREGELTGLKGHLREANAGRGRWVALHGEAGVGKSRLGAELCGYARLGGVKVLRGRCLEGGAPYEGFRGIFEGVAERYRGVDEDSVPRGVRKAAPALAMVFPSMRELVLEEDSMSGGSLMPAEERQRVALAARGALFAISSETPLLLFVEDLHAADEATIALSAAFAVALGEAASTSRGPRILFATTHRDDALDDSGPHPLRRALERLAADGRVDRVHLGPLSRAEVAELATSMTGTRPAEEFIDRLFEESGGNPYFAEELLKAWGDEGQGKQIPPTLSAAVEERVSRLSPRARDVALVATVLGREFEMDVLIAASGAPEVEVLDAVEELVQRRILAEDQRYSREVLRFRQEITRQSMYEKLPLARRREVHLAAARALDDVQDAPTEIVGRHYLAGGDAAAAMRYLERAATEAAASYANGDALRLHDLALTAERDVAASVRDRFRLLCGRAAVLDHLARREEERRTIEEAERLARRSGDAGMLCDSYIQWAQHYNVTAEGESAQDMSTRALVLARERSDRFREARSLRELARSHAARGDYERCFDFLEEVLPLAQELGDVAMEATALGTMGVCQMALGDFVVSRRRLLDAADRWRRIGDRRSLASTLANVALVDQGTGRFGECLRLMGEVLRIRQQIGHRHGEAQATAELVNTRRLLGDLDGARKDAEVALELAREVESATIAAQTYLYLAMAELDAEEAEALAAADRAATCAAAEARAAGDPGLEARALAVLAEAERRRGRTTESLALVDKALERLAVRGYASFGGEEEVFWTQSRVLEDAGRIDAAADALARAYSRVRTKADRIEDAELRRRFLQAVPLHRAIVSAWESRERRNR
ncbi:MAG: protein kinase [Deltaproteobacteria bacterium]|nr:protein kinase [Deltaproteobacteria bacterium]